MMFITLEGVEGSGKSTQARLLAEALRAEGRDVLVTREPGGEPVAEAIREALLAPASAVAARTELLLFLAARAQLTERVIRPALESGQMVICDRYIDSTTAYQGYARGFDLALTARLNDFATGGLVPDRTILLDLDPAAGLRRQLDHNRMEAESVDFHRRVRAGFLALAQAEPDRFIVLDATQPPESIHADILRSVQAALSAESN